MFLTCKQVSNHLSKEDYDKLPAFKKMTMKFHVLICPVCGKYNQQVMKFQDMARTFRNKQDEILDSDSPNSPKMNEDAKKRLQEAVDQEKVS
jgi:hypothetical protein